MARAGDCLSVYHRLPAEESEKNFSGGSNLRGIGRNVFNRVAEDFQSPDNFIQPDFGAIGFGKIFDVAERG